MKRAVLLTAIMVMVLLIVPMEQGGIVTANMFLWASVEIKSPLSYANITYQSSTIDIIVSVKIAASNDDVYTISYSLDDKPEEQLSLSEQSLGGTLGTGTLKNLSDGYHSLKVYYTGYFKSKEGFYSTVFLVNSTGFQSPRLQLLSPMNTTYSKNDIPLILFNEETKYLVYYRIDNSDYSAIASNITLSELAEGQHTINIKIMDGDSLYSEETTYFSVNTAKSNQSTSNSIFQIAIIALAFGGLFVAFAIDRRHRKTAKSNNSSQQMINMRFR